MTNGPPLVWRMTEAMKAPFRLHPRRRNVPEFIQLEVTNFCNLDCPMCQRHDLKVELVHMDWDIFERTVNWVDSSIVPRMTFQGWGEPLTHPRIFDMIGLARDRGFFLTAITNGTLFQPRMRKKIIDSGLQVLCVSVEHVDEPENSDQGHGNHDNLLDAEALIKEAAEIGTDRPGGEPLRIFFVVTVIETNRNDIARIVDRLADTSAYGVILQRLDLRFAKDLPAIPFAEEKQIWSKAEDAAKRRGIYLEHPGSRFNLISRAFLQIEERCPRPYNNLYVNREGIVTPCCGIPRYKLGHIDEDSLMDVWTGKKLQVFRQRQNSVCGDCRVLKYY